MLIQVQPECVPLLQVINYPGFGVERYGSRRLFQVRLTIYVPGSARAS